MVVINSYQGIRVLIRSDGASEDNDTIYDDQIAAGQTKGYQTTWGPPVRYSRKDHCLQILVIFN